MQFLAVYEGYVFAVHYYLTVSRLLKVDDGTSESGFAASGLTYDAHGLSFFYGECHIVDSVV